MLESYLAKPAFNATCDQIFGAVVGVQQGSNSNDQELQADAMLLLPMLAVATGLHPDALNIPTGYSIPSSSSSSNVRDPHRRRRKNNSNHNAPTVLLTADEFRLFARLALREAHKKQFAPDAAEPEGSAGAETGAMVANSRSRHSQSAPSSNPTRNLDTLAADQSSSGSGIGPNSDVWFDLIPCDAPAVKPSTAPSPDRQRKQGDDGGGSIGTTKKSGPAKGPRRRKLVPLVAAPQPPVPIDRITEEVCKQNHRFLTFGCMCDCMCIHLLLAMKNLCFHAAYL